MKPEGKSAARGSGGSKKYRILPWDTKFFGFGVAKILPDKLKAVELENILHLLKKKNIPLVYWASDSNDKITQAAARKSGGFLADEKTTFLINLDKVDFTNFSPDDNIKEYSASALTRELEELAVDCGEYSRFHVDKRIDDAKFQELYKLWLKKAIAGILAEKVLVYRKKGEKITGMIVLAGEEKKAEFTMAAVKKSRRGRGLGELLFSEGAYWFYRRGYESLQIITQGKNKTACNLYKKLGFRIVKVENFYHFWLE